MSSVAERVSRADRQSRRDQVWALRQWAEQLGQEQERRERLLERALETLQRLLDEAADIHRELHELVRPASGASGMSDGDGAPGDHHGDHS